MSLNTSLCASTANELKSEKSTDTPGQIERKRKEKRKRRNGNKTRTKRTEVFKDFDQTCDIPGDFDVVETSPTRCDGTCQMSSGDKVTGCWVKRSKRARVQVDVKDIGAPRSGLIATGRDENCEKDTQENYKNSVTTEIEHDTCQDSGTSTEKPFELAPEDVITMEMEDGSNQVVDPCGVVFVLSEAKGIEDKESDSTMVDSVRDFVASYLAACKEVVDMSETNGELACAVKKECLDPEDNPVCTEVDSDKGFVSSFLAVGEEEVDRGEANEKLTSEVDSECRGLGDDRVCIVVKDLAACDEVVDNGEAKEILTCEGKKECSDLEDPVSTVVDYLEERKYASDGQETVFKPKEIDKGMGEPCTIAEEVTKLDVESTSVSPIYDPSVHLEIEQGVNIFKNEEWKEVKEKAYKSAVEPSKAAEGLVYEWTDSGEEEDGYVVLFQNARKDVDVEKPQEPNTVVPQLAYSTTDLQQKVAALEVENRRLAARNEDLTVAYRELRSRAAKAESLLRTERRKRRDYGDSQGRNQVVTGFSQCSIL